MCVCVCSTFAPAAFSLLHIQLHTSRLILQVSPLASTCCVDDLPTFTEGHRAGEMLAGEVAALRVQTPVKRRTQVAFDWVNRFWKTLCTLGSSLSEARTFLPQHLYEDMLVPFKAALTVAVVGVRT